MLIKVNVCGGPYRSIWGVGSSLWLAPALMMMMVVVVVMLCSWLRSTVGGTLVFVRRTDPVLRLACSRRVTTMWVSRPLQVSQLSLSSFQGR